MKNILIVTGGAGFIGSNIISELLKFKKFRILSIDNYSTGLSKNHIKNKRVKYLIGNTQNIEVLLKSYVGKFIAFFISANSQEFFKVLKIFMNVLVQISTEAPSYFILP